MFTLTRREFLSTAGLALGMPRAHAEAGEILHNGIRLASPWPPGNRYFAVDPQTPPYLADPPAVIPIDVGRQLFVDDFLIEESSLTRTFHRAEYYPKNPVLRPATPWERRDEYAERTLTRSNPAAMVFSDGVFYDPADRIFKLWYMGGYQQNTCLALSNDGLNWERPSLDVVPGTNIVIAAQRDSSTVWLDLEASDPASRYKMSLTHGDALLLFAAPDGIHWRQVGRAGPSGDRNTIFYNPFRKVWVFSLRDTETAGVNRYRRYYECRDFASAHWRVGEPTLWMKADALDLQRTDYRVPVQIYNLDGVAYESIILGLFAMYRGEWHDREKPNDICVGFSRDGFHWARPNREAFISVSERIGDWNWGNVQSAGGCCLVVGDRLYFYVSGRRGVPGTSSPGICSTGLAMLRRDGFASLSDEPDRRRPARVSSSGLRRITTRPVRFSGRHLFVNAEVGGELRVEVLDRAGRVIEPFSFNRAKPIAGDGTRLPVSWDGATTLHELAGEPVRFRFSLTRGRLYAFWVSPSPDGRSHGYVAAGGPGFTRPVDA